MTPKPRPMSRPMIRPMTRPWATLALMLALSACAGPPPAAYVTAGADARALPAGADARGEACTVQPGRAPALDRPVARAEEVYCGGWTQPSARLVALRGPAGPADLQALATGGIWRRALEERLACGAPQPATLASGAAALVMSCTRRGTGFAQVALVVAGPEGPVLADGTPAAAPVIERLATGRAEIAAGGAAARSEALQLAVSRLSAQAFGAGDIGEYERLMGLGRELNQVENFAGAEEAYRAALAMQGRVVGADNPDTVAPLTLLALNLSNQRRYEEAEAAFRRAAALAPRATDRLAPPRVLHYRALHALNMGRDAQAMELLAQAEAGYRPFIPPSLLAGAGDVAELVAVAGGLSGSLQGQAAVIGLAEVRRHRAAALARAGNRDQARAELAESRRLLRMVGTEPSVIAGRSLRLEATLADGAGGAGLLDRAARRFRQASPDERPEATTLFLAGQRRVEAGQPEAALEDFRRGATILRARRLTLRPEEVVPYLDALSAAAERAPPAEAAALRAESFAAAQLAQRGDTVRFVARAAARLSTGSAGGAAAVREMQDLDNELRALFAERDGAVASAAGRAAIAALDERIADRQAARGRAEERVAEEVPSFRQLELRGTTAERVGAALRPQEALVMLLLGRDHGHAIAVLPGGEVQARRIALGEAEAAALVRRIRAGIDAPAGRRSFDTAAAAELHARLLGSLDPVLAPMRGLVVVPDGPLLGIPFGLLLTAPAEPTLAGLREAPWLIRRAAISHALSPQIFVTLRAGSAASAAPLPYLGFADFRAPTDAQLRARFPAETCAEDAQLARGLAPLPGTRFEVELTRRLLGAGAEATRFGAEFTAAAVQSAPLSQYRILHFATHALLPGELSCVPEPALVVSPAAGARDAASAFLPASELLRLRLDADLVMLSACNTAGPATGVAGVAGNAGEALSGLARSFFFAGARGLLVTHWPAGDRAAAAIVIQTMRRQQAGDASADALRSAQLALIEEAGRDLPASFAHPFAWAGFALVGDGRRPAPVLAGRPGEAAALPRPHPRGA